MKPVSSGRTSAGTSDPCGPTNRGHNSAKRDCGAAEAAPQRNI